MAARRRWPKSLLVQQLLFPGRACGPDVCCWLELDGRRDRAVRGPGSPRLLPCLQHTDGHLRPCFVPGRLTFRRRHWLTRSSPTEEIDVATQSRVDTIGT